MWQNVKISISLFIFYFISKPPNISVYFSPSVQKNSPLVLSSFHLFPSPILSENTSDFPFCLGESKAPMCRNPRPHFQQCAAVVPAKVTSWLETLMTPKVQK